MTLTASDMFCGAGGSSIGAEGIPGVKLSLALNHWSMPMHHSHGLNRRIPTTEEPLPTQTGRQEQGLVTLPFMLSQQFYRDGDEKRVYGIDEPMRTVVAEGNHAAIVVPLRRNGKAKPTDQPVDTVTADGNHHALVIRHYGTPEGQSAAHLTQPVTSPFGTVTSSDHHSLLEMPFTVDYHGTGHAHPVGEPLPTQDSRDRHGLVQPAIDIEDCGFRMLETHEIGKAMAFPETYAVLGNKRQRVRQYGQAVTPPVMKMILERAVESLS